MTQLRVGGTFDRCRDVLGKLFRPTERLADPSDLQLSGGELAGWLAMLLGTRERSLVADEHTVEDRGSTLLWLGVHTA